MTATEADALEAQVVIRIVYTEEPTIGVLGNDLVLVDRGLRDAVRHARADHALGRRSGWPSLAESARVERATTNSPLEIVSVVALGVAGNLTYDLLKALFRERVGERLAGRPRGRASLKVGFSVKLDVTHAQPPDEEWLWPDQP